MPYTTQPNPPEPGTTSWLTTVANTLPEYALELQTQLTEIMTVNSLNSIDANCCALAAAAATSNGWLTQTIAVGSEFSGEVIQRDEALTQGTNMSYQGVYYPYVGLADDVNYENEPGQLYKNKVARDAQAANELEAEIDTDKARKELYALSANIVNHCVVNINNYYRALKKIGYSVTNLGDVGKIAGVIAATAKVLSGYSLNNLVAVTSADSDYTPTIMDQYVGVAGNIGIISLPNNPIQGRIYTIKNELPNVGSTIINTIGNALIDGNVEVILGTYDSVTLVYRDNNWHIVERV